ncbi:hypothetical protein DB345_01850 [Spartobacteria bacterium LR76]|nr:hypothetical protein DB345_01850 [Spartobacteria bacterium LR76]
MLIETPGSNEPMDEVLPRPFTLETPPPRLDSPPGQPQGAETNLLPTSPSPAGDRWMNIFHGDETWQGRWNPENDVLLSFVDDPESFKMSVGNAHWIADQYGETLDAVGAAYPMAQMLVSQELLGHMDGSDEDVFRAIGDSLVPTLTMEDITGVREQPLSRLESYVPRSIYLSNRVPELEEAISYSDLGRKVFTLSWPGGLPPGVSLSDAEAEQIGRQAWREKRAEEKRRKSFENYDEFQLEKTLFGSMAESSLTMAEGPVFWLDKRLELQPGLGYEGTTADTWMNATLGFFEGQRKLAQEYYAVDPEFAESYAGKVAGAVGAAVPQLVAMRVPVAAVVGIGGQSFLHAWEDAENTAMRRGEKFDPNRAYAYATTMAALNTALTFLEFDKVLGPWRKGQSELLGDNLIKLFRSATGAGAVNAVQGGVNDLGATAFGIETRNPFDPERRWDDFTVGTGAGLVLGAGARIAKEIDPESVRLHRIDAQAESIVRSGNVGSESVEKTEPAFIGTEFFDAALVVSRIKNNPSSMEAKALTAWFNSSHIRIQKGELKAYESVLNEFLRQLPAYGGDQGVLYRGLRFKNENDFKVFLDQWMNGKWSPRSPFMSASKIPEVAFEFAEAGNIPVFWEIVKHHSARDIEPFSFLVPRYAYQKEVLFTRSAQFELIEMWKLEYKGRTVYLMRVQEVD